VSGAVGELLERCRAAGLLLTAEDEALHVPFEREPPGELIEELRQRKPEIMAALASATATTPPQLFESEPFYHEPCPTRRGLIRHSEGRFRAFLRRLRQLGFIRLRCHQRSTGPQVLLPASAMSGNLAFLMAGLPEAERAARFRELRALAFVYFGRPRHRATVRWPKPSLIRPLARERSPFSTPCRRCPAVGWLRLWGADGALNGR
jgi:hypothetical protein